MGLILRHIIEGDLQLQRFTIITNLAHRKKLSITGRTLTHRLRQGSRLLSALKLPKIIVKIVQAQVIINHL